jgi:serine-type D-Ala-D-Ala carboxypeptidase/endopeptidase (penicillin-binding protein 4)
MKERLFRIYRLAGLCVAFTVLSIVMGLSTDAQEDFVSLSRLQQNIKTALKTSILKNASIGIQIVSVDSGEVMYEHDSDLMLNPASNTKLLTSATALVKLNPEYQFITSVYRKGQLKNGVLSGDIYLRGGGDPSLSYEALLKLAYDVHNAGIRTIAGNVIGDDSFFDTEREFTGWQDFDRAYSGRLSALSLNYNAVRLFVKPSSRSGGTPKIILEPPTSYVKVHNKAVTSSKSGIYASFSSSDSPDDELPLPEETLVIRGKISTKSRYGVSAYVYVNNPSLYATTSFKDALEQMGITVNGQAMLGEVPPKSQRVTTYASESLSRIICDSNKVSNNFVAEQILKTLGAEVIGKPGTTEKGLRVVAEFLEDLDIPADAYVLENGSGLSRNNRLSPELIVTLLTFMYENFEVRSEFMASLAIAGVDGTLRKRLRDTQAERRLRAKTGALTAVSCLSGYAASRDNEVFAFSIMMNSYRSGGYAVQEIQNEIGLLLTEFYRPTYNAKK